MIFSLDHLKAHYARIADSNGFALHLAFVKELLASNEPDILDFHYELLVKSGHNLDLYQRLCRAFEQRGKIGRDYLLGRIETETNSQIKGDVLHILGKMNAPELIPLAASFLQSPDTIMRYKAIIVLGWNGDINTLLLLDERLLNEPDPELRGYAATAMRQIWYRHPTTELAILGLYQTALQQEENEIVSRLIIASTQTLMKKKLGIKETQNGEISGDIAKAKSKALRALTNYLSPKQP
jgi:HEAT repeats